MPLMILLANRKLRNKLATKRSCRNIFWKAVRCSVDQAVVVVVVVVVSKAQYNILLQDYKCVLYRSSHN